MTSQSYATQKSEIIKTYRTVFRLMAWRCALTLLLWQTRMTERSHLAELPDHRLTDMGLSRVQALQEAAKPFWRA